MSADDGEALAAYRKVMGESSSTGEAAADAADEPGDGWTLKDLLLSTEPNIRPETLGRAGYTPTEAHIIIAARKMLSVIMPSLADVRGTPAIQNLGTAAWYYYIGATWDWELQGAEQLDGAEEATEPDPDAEGERVTARTPEEAEEALRQGHRVDYQPEGEE